MTDLESFKDVEKNYLHDWAEKQTTSLDLVASWENLCDAYKSLEFADQLSDTAKLEEFKWIIKSMNQHLSRARRTLLTCKDIQATRMALLEMFRTPENAKLTCRKEITYQKMKQRWIVSMLGQLEQMEAELIEQLQEVGDLNG